MYMHVYPYIECPPTENIHVYHMQGKVVGLNLGAGSLARTISPFWCKLFTIHSVHYIYNIVWWMYSTVVESYRLTQRHTYFAMGISTGLALVLLVSLAVLYKNLAPLDEQKSEHSTINATSALAVMGQDPQSMDFVCFCVCV